MRDSQAVDGAYPSVAPTGPWQLVYGALGWADAGILVPYYVWHMSGDTTIIEENYLSMRIYMDHFLGGKGTAGRPRASNCTDETEGKSGRVAIFRLSRPRRSLD